MWSIFYFNCRFKAYKLYFNEGDPTVDDTCIQVCRFVIWKALSQATGSMENRGVWKNGAEMCFPLRLSSE